MFSQQPPLSAPMAADPNRTYVPVAATESLTLAVRNFEQQITHPAPTAAPGYAPHPTYETQPYRHEVTYAQDPRFAQTEPHRQQFGYSAPPPAVAPQYGYQRPDVYASERSNAYPQQESQYRTTPGVYGDRRSVGNYASRNEPESHYRSAQSGPSNSSSSYSRYSRQERPTSRYDSDNNSRDRSSSHHHSSHSDRPRHSGYSSSSSDSHGPRVRYQTEGEFRLGFAKGENVPYVGYYRRYNVCRDYWSMIELKRVHADMPLNTDLKGVKVQWNNSIGPLLPSDLENPTIPINQPVPAIISNATISSLHHPPPVLSVPEGTFRTQVRVLLLRGLPIDISAPKGGVVHSNSNINFILLEQPRPSSLHSSSTEPPQPFLRAPGGIYDPSLDGPNSNGTGISTKTEEISVKSEEVSEKTSAPSNSAQSTDNVPVEYLIRTAIRTVKAQLNIDLSSCTKWCRFVDVEYCRDSSLEVNDRVVYLLPSLWEILPSEETFASMWQEWRRYEAQAPIIVDIERLKSHLESTKESQVQLIEDLKHRLAAKEADLKDIPVPEFDEAPPKPMLLIHPTASQTFGCKAVNWSLMQLQQLDPPTSMNAPVDESLDIFLVAHRFDEFLQYFFGLGLLNTVAKMRDYHLGGERRLTVNGVPLAFPSGEDQTNSSQSSTSDASQRLWKKRSHDEQLPNTTAEDETNLEPDTKKSVTSTSGSQRDSDRVIGVPMDNRKGRPPKTPEARDYRLMQALRYFDMHRLGLIRGEDLEVIFLSLGIEQITGKVATELAACADSTLPHKPFLLTNYDPYKTIRYKPICDWLKNSVQY